MGQKHFFIVKTAFFENVCFYWHLRSQTNDLIVFKIFVRTPLDPYEIRNTLMFITLDDTRKKGRKLLSSWKQLFFEVFVSIDPLGAKEMFLSFEQSWPKHLLGPFRLFHELSTFDITKKNGQNLFFTRKIAFFWKLCVFNNLLGLKKMLLQFQSKSQNTFWTLINCSLMFFILDITRKNRPKTFATAKKDFSWNVCFCQPLRSQRNVIINCTINVKTLCGPL